MNDKAVAVISAKWDGPSEQPMQALSDLLALVGCEVEKTSVAVVFDELAASASKQLSMSALQNNGRRISNQRPLRFDVDTEFESGVAQALAGGAKVRYFEFAAMAPLAFCDKAQVAACAGVEPAKIFIYTHAAPAKSQMPVMVDVVAIAFNIMADDQAANKLAGSDPLRYTGEFAQDWNFFSEKDIGWQYSGRPAREMFTALGLDTKGVIPHVFVFAHYRPDGFETAAGEFADAVFFTPDRRPDVIRQFDLVPASKLGLTRVPQAREGLCLA
jgi:hypothetical protein